MYIVETKKNKYKMVDKKSVSNIEGYPFGRKSHKIAGVQIVNLIICNKKMARPIVRKQVDKKYKKLISVLTELLVSDDETGSALMEVLNQIEKFRQMIKNKYRQYLTKKDLEIMSQKLSMIQKDTQEKLEELQYSLTEEKRRSSCR